MKLGAIVLAVVLAGSALAGVVWLGKYTDSPLPIVASAAEDAASDPGEPLPIADSGPYPKAVVEEAEHDFGLMALGEKRKHTFVVRNEGKVPLKLKKGQSTCKCTLSELAKDEIAPGEAAEIELEWEPKASSEEFEQTAWIWTNDPENKKLELKVHGRVEQLLTIMPEGRWDIGLISEGTPTTVTGTLHSAILDDFAITGIETSSPLITAEAVRLTGDQLTQLPPEAKSAFQITATIQPEMPVGSFKESITVKADARGEKEFTLEVHGTRSGPLQFVKMPGYDWYPNDFAMSFGRFKAAEGKKGTILVIVQGMDGKPFELTDVQADPDFLKVSLTPLPNNTPDRQSYHLTIEVPPGSPPLTRIRRTTGAGEILMKTNHPGVPELKMFAEFVSY